MILKTQLKRSDAFVRWIEAMFGVKCELDYHDDYPALYNDPEFTKFVVDTIKEADTDAIKNVERCEPQPPSEDFAYYAKQFQAHLFMLVLHQKMVKSIPTIILNLISVKVQCEFLQKQ